MAVGKGITLPLTLNPKEFIRGIKVAERGLEQFEDALEGVEDAGDEAADALETGFKGALSDTVTRAEDLEAAFAEVGAEGKDAADKVETAFRNADIDVAGGVESAAGSAKQAAGVLAGEVVDEFVENWGEAVRSGDYGSAVRETLSQLGQIGGAVGGPAGAVIGGALALGLTAAFDNAMKGSEQAERVRAAVRDIFLGVEEDAAEAGGNSWVAYRDAVLAAVQSDEAIAAALGVESFAEAIDLIDSKGETLGQTWENNVTLALTDSGVAGEQAAKRVVAEWEESNARISELERDRQTLIENGQADQLGNIDALLAEERSRNEELETGVGWLEQQGAIAGELEESARNQYTQDQLITTEKQDQAAASRQTKDNVANTKDKGLPTLKGDTAKAAEKTGKARSDLANMPDASVKINVDRSEVNDAFEKIEGIPGQVNTTLSVTVQGANAKANRILAVIGNS